MKEQKAKCPECGGTDLDHWPRTDKFAYCYTCHETVQVVCVEINGENKK